MSLFRFDFDITNDSDEGKEYHAIEKDCENNIDDDKDPHSYVNLKVIPFQEQNINQLHYDTLALSSNCSMKFVKHVEAFELSDKSDIVSGIYEGGLKVWECSIDLCRYIYENYCTSLTCQESKPISVLELGCGHGLPGCLVLKMIPNATVLFSDFNDFVLKFATIPNVNLNCVDNKQIGERGIFVSGDWNKLSNQLLNGSLMEQQQVEDRFCGKFDLVVAAETTYTPKAAEETAKLFAAHIKSPDGVGIIANKRYYFGCGGGSDAFRYAMRRESLHVETLYEFNDGSSNIRDLLKVSWM